MKLIVIMLTMMGTSALFANSSSLENVIRTKISRSNEYVRDLETVADRERIRAWLPTSPNISYSSNDNHTWKAWTVSTSVPLPIKSYYRDGFHSSAGRLMKEDARQSKQEILQETVEIYLDCFVPREMVHLLEEALNDQKIMTSVASSLYATGAIPQSDRVASELQLRQLDAQFKAQADSMEIGCHRWSRFGEEIPKQNESDEIASTISDEILESLDLKTDAKKDFVERKLENISLNKKHLWSKYIPDLEFSAAKNNYFDLYKSGGPPIKYTYNWTVGITLPFTFPFYDNTEYRKEYAELSIARMKAELERTQTRKIWQQAKRDWKRIVKRLHEIETKDMALAEAFVEGSLASYRSGKVGLADLALARKTKLDLKIEQVNLKAQKLMAKTICLSECEI